MVICANKLRLPSNRFPELEQRAVKTLPVATFRLLLQTQPVRQLYNLAIVVLCRIGDLGRHPDQCTPQQEGGETDAACLTAIAQACLELRAGTEIDAFTFGCFYQNVTASSSTYTILAAVKTEIHPQKIFRLIREYAAHCLLAQRETDIYHAALVGSG